MDDVRHAVEMRAPAHAATAPDPLHRFSVLRRAGLRVAPMVLAAMAAYGTWAFFANLAHGAPVALRAGLTQGASSGVTTLVIGSVIEALHATLRPGRYRALLATGVAATLSSGVHLGVHLIAGTPEILRTILPSVVAGYLFAALYAFSLEGPRVRVGVRRPGTLSAADREAIWSLLSRSVQRDRRAFEDKLAKTEAVMLGHLPDGALVAFAALDIVELSIEGRIEALLYTHWAVIDPRVRGCHLIQRFGTRAYLRYRLRHPLRRVYWMFTASTFQGYLLLVRNFTTYWPRPEASFPPFARALVAAAMGDDPSYDAGTGVLRRHGATRYREGVVHDDRSILDHPTLGPALRFYHAQNPGQVEGDSLVCLCPLTAANWWSCARVALARIRRGKRRAGVALTRARPQTFDAV